MGAVEGMSNTDPKEAHETRSSCNVPITEGCGLGGTQSPWAWGMSWRKFIEGDDVGSFDGRDGDREQVPSWTKEETSSKYESEDIVIVR